jgi:SAM-dependent methyltransferase
VARCFDCGLLRLDPRPSPEALIAGYSDSYYAYVGRTRGRFKQAVWDALRDASSGAPDRRWLRSLRFAARPIAERVFDVNVPLDRRTRVTVLDFGCGYGDLLIYLKSRGCAVQGVDIDAQAARRAREYGVPVHVGGLENVGVPEASVDEAILCHSLEHVSSPADVLRQLSTLVKPGGAVRIAVPNGEAAGLRTEGVHWGHLSYPLHFWYFDASSLGRLLRDSGFEPVATRYGMTWGFHIPLWRRKLTKVGALPVIRKVATFIAEVVAHPARRDILRMVAVRRG